MEFFKRYERAVSLGAIAIVTLIGLVYWIFCAPPVSFPTSADVTIERGASVEAIANELTDRGFIRTAGSLLLVLKLTGSSDHVQAGTYHFSSPENVFVIAKRITTGNSGIPPIRITFPEGITVRSIAKTVATRMDQDLGEEVLALGKLYEGYLFPDTYLFLPTTNAATIVQTMRDTFDAKLAPLAGDIAASGHSISDIVVMASLVEKEVRTTENRKIVAGILWSRLARKMPLQVDAVFGYIFDKETYSPTYTDLQVDSPYNTYTHIGLPPGPICNPGLDAISAVIHPTKTNYLYYLTDKNGGIHYATTYAEHQLNEQRYLR